jgi:hypothetical protein
VQRPAEFCCLLNHNVNIAERASDQWIHVSYDHVADARQIQALQHRDRHRCPAQ